MLLLVKGQAPRTLCKECRKLYEPSSGEVKTQQGQRPVFICGSCRVAITERFRWLNAPKRRANGRAL